ncbi:hypothetical protein AK812_SmicGene36733 [Symbiodinium microadriaticum]|uniref:Retrovirus-related Pol polyprotein from transposon TNT 1-94 n=1 Tax=Symbiodinium microadriaticum TaxID=2951 RepID=A0A1Q9CI38_SYMMI|nr:hypothetical protein AK812_SmicGene36733 [Symbiodinium microadriaticum]
MAASGSGDGPGVPPQVPVAGPQAQDIPVAPNPFSPTANAAAANEQRLMQVLESVTLLLQNQAAASAATTGSTSVTPVITGKDLSKIIKQPEAFHPKDRDAELSMWPAWSWQFEQWLGCVHKDFVADISRIRANLNVPIVQTALTMDEAERSRLLFGTLAGLLHEKGCRMLRTIPLSCGFEGYRRLVQDLTPSSRSRLLALIQMVHAWPAFNMKIGLVQQLSKFESAVQEYESLSGTTMSDDAKLASVLKCLSGQLKTQAMIHVTETSTHNDLRSLIERWDSGQARWNDALPSSYGITSQKDPNGPAPMEIDRVYKGKDKGKKGKHGDPKGGKPKGGKGQDQWKSNSWDSKGKGKGKGQAKEKAAKMAKDVPVYAFDDDDDAVDLTVFSEWCDDGPSICAVQFSMCATDDDGCWTLPQGEAAPNVVQTESIDPVGSIVLDSLDVVQTESDSDSMPVGSNSCNVCAVISGLSFDPADSSAGEPIEMIVDSGADESCLPMSMAYTGHPLHVHDRRACVMQFLNLEQRVRTFKETCLVSSVSSPLFAVGKLYRLGWGTFWHGDQFVLGLQSDPSTYIPCSFKHNSIIAKGWIRRVHALPPSIPSSPKNANVSAVGMQVRAVAAKLGKVLERLIRDATYFQPLVDGVWGIQLETDKFVDVHEALPNEGLEYRTTLAYLEGQWKLLELSEHIDRLYNFVKRYNIQQRLAEHPSPPVPNEVEPVVEPSDEASDVSQHGVPVISFDFSFTGRGATSRSYLDSEVARLLNMLGYGTVKLRCDPEGTCLSLRDEIVKRRSKFGHRTLFDQVAEGEHQGNGGAEAAVHQTRLQAGVLLSQYEARSGKTVHTTHPLQSWSMRHASWLLNRFGQARSGTTPFEDIMNTTYRGKICSFGMAVLSLARGTAKGRPSWVKSIWLGKSATSDQHITCAAGGRLLLTRSVRLLTPQYDASLRDSVRDHSWQHPGLLAGTVGKSASQRTKEVTDTGAVAVANDGVGPVTPLILPPPGTPDEAGSDPPSDKDSSAGVDEQDDGNDDDSDEQRSALYSPDLTSSANGEGSQQSMSGAASVAGSLHGDASGRGVGFDDEAGGAHSSASAATEAHVGERPAKSAKEATHKVPRINAVNAKPHNDTPVQVHEGAHNDAEVTPFLESAELDALEDYDYALDDSGFVQTFDDSQFLGTPSELYRPKPADGGDPQLSASELEQIDAVAEDFEVNRLVQMGVLAPLEDDDPFVRTARLLSTKYVTTWHKGWVSLSLDISDAFLTVSQKIDTCIRVRTASGGSRFFRLIKMLPGQRDGMLNCAAEFTSFLREKVSIETFPQCPALCRTADCQAGLLIHVDDVYGAGHRKKLQEIASAIQSKCKATLAWLIEPGNYGDASPQQACGEIGQHAAFESRRAKATPMPTTVPLDQAPLDEGQAGTYRSAVGILLYLAPDAIESQNCVRLLSQQMSAPTVGGLKLLKHLVCYLKSVTGCCLAFGTPVPVQEVRLMIDDMAAETAERMSHRTDKPAVTQIPVMLELLRRID